mmetsp:Transcript_22191/g.30561  ORF Transcript_22191/g.30561 Transcript_22191/m.30561 type:complete len:89 (+) Transcript_22191:1-267(+)
MFLGYNIQLFNNIEKCGKIYILKPSTNSLFGFYNNIKCNFNLVIRESRQTRYQTNDFINCRFFVFYKICHTCDFIWMKFKELGVHPSL